MPKAWCFQGCGIDIEFHYRSALLFEAELLEAIRPEIAAIAGATRVTR